MHLRRAFNLPAKDRVRSIRDRLLEAAVEDLIDLHLELVSHDVVPNSERIVIAQLHDQIRDHLLPGVFVYSPLFAAQAVPKPETLVYAFATNQVESKIRSRTGGWPDCVLQCFGIFVVDLPNKIKELRQEFNISLRRETQLCERFVVPSVPEIEVAEIPARIRVIGRERDGPFQRELGLRGIAGLLLRRSQRHPETIIVRREAYGFLVFGNGGGLLIQRQCFLCDLCDAPMRQRIVGRHSRRHVSGVESAFSGIKILRECIAEIPAYYVVRPKTCCEQQKDQQDLDRQFADVNVNHFLWHLLALRLCTYA